MKLNFCLRCSKELKGRSDKKFCDAQCRSMHHNTNKPLHEQTIQQTNRILRKNRKILAYFCPVGKNTVRKEALVELGYQFGFFTHIIPYTSGTYYFCYEYGYLPMIEKNISKVLIVQKQNYMNHTNYNPWKYCIAKN